MLTAKHKRGNANLDLAEHTDDLFVEKTTWRYPNVANENITSIMVC